MTSLTEFAAGRGWGCPICRIAAPILAEIDAGLAAGIKTPTIHNWLVQVHEIRIPNASERLRRHRTECLSGNSSREVVAFEPTAPRAPARTR